ncbi:alpha/beta hydrolase [Roseospira navarrensis]|uniref:Alpha/beta hydrolase n=1 Tax=Roseospira navarrensis TaxID=140058 RepID=A0A7X1ZFM4_9PROT|nr:alpha/beta hydrolase [Roseospira navarrensis]MQX36512.1 alpha/beta hydrolase [Roseospira navarrensis]
MAGLLAACATGSGVPDRATLEAQARAHGFERLTVGDPALPLVAWLRPGTVPEGGTLTVVIEGDGAAWPRRDRPPADPTPARPVGLGLALADPAPAVAALARPCQYHRPAACTVALWTTERFSDEAVRLADAALDDLRQRTGAETLRLVGYSGGAHIAARLAAARHDVTTLETVAGVLDPAAWTAHHGVTPLPPLPPDTRAALARLPDQRHWIGAEDRIVPPDLARGVLERLGRGDTARVVPGFDHACCWGEAWSDLTRTPFVIPPPSR